MATNNSFSIKSLRREHERSLSGFSGIGSYDSLMRKQIKEWEVKEERRYLKLELERAKSYIKTHGYPSGDQLRHLMPEWKSYIDQVCENNCKTVEKYKQSIISRKQKRIKDNFKGKLQSLLEHTSAIPDLSSDDYVMDIDDIYFSDLLYHYNTELIDSTLEFIMESAKNNNVLPYLVRTYKCENCGIYNEMPYLFEKSQKYYNSNTQLFLEKFLKDELPSKSRVSVSINSIKEAFEAGFETCCTGNGQPTEYLVYDYRFYVEVSIEFSYPQKS